MGDIVRRRCRPSPVWSRAERRQHVEDQEAVCLGVQDYCFAHGLNPQAFYGWRRRVLAESRDLDVEAIESRRPVVPVFVEIDVDLPEPLPEVSEAREQSEVAETSVALGRSEVDVLLRCGHRLRVGPDFDEAALRRLVALLESTSC